MNTFTLDTPAPASLARREAEEMTNAPRLSAIIITKNEAHNLPECLAALHWVHEIVVVDAESNDDLAILAEAVSDSTAHLLAGSAGFSTQIARCLGQGNGSNGSRLNPRRVRSVLTVAGSRHVTAARQVAALEASGVETIRLSFERGHLDPATTERAIERLAGAFAEERSVTLTTCETPNSLLPGFEIARALAAIATDARICESFDAMILTGGDVADAVCDRLEADAITLGGEVLPAIPWGTLEGGSRPRLPLVTKAGSFGGDRAMVDAVRFLTQMTN